MYLDALHIRNFRRLRDVVIDLDKDISIFVGANNSGKTSVAQLLQLFLSAAKEKFSLHDFSASVWSEIEDFADPAKVADLPEISVDLWFCIQAADLHRVIDLLPNLAWQGSKVGVRIALSPADPDGILARFQEALAAAPAANLAEPDGANGAGEGDAGGGQHNGDDDDFQPSPRNLTEYLRDALHREYKFRYYVLDRAKFDDDYVELADSEPHEIVPDKDPNQKTRSGRDIVDSLVRVDFLQAQRHLSDSSGGSRSEDLSRHLSRFYRRNLEKRADDYQTIRALSQSEKLMNDHLADVFSATLARLSELGYPGLTNPSLKILSELNPAILMSSHDGTQVHYALDDTLTLPEKYTGLGFKNLIYMVVELLDLHYQWLDIEDKRPPLHLVFIEEPEAHLHTQLQQVFVNKVLDILRLEGDDAVSHASQIVLTTHSPHILYERGFRPTRYFRRESSGKKQSTSVLNLSKFYETTEDHTRDFLERYLKLTHCDLFFADAAILVEGNVERLLMPLMIQMAAPRLRSVFLCVLEIGGAFGHCFQSLIGFLGLTTLIVTDLDSVRGLPVVEVDGADAAADIGGDLNEHEPQGEVDELEDVDEEDAGGPKIGSTCRVEDEHAVTSNQTLIQWLPRKTRIADLRVATPEERTQIRGVNGQATVRVCYQTRVTVTRGEESIVRTGRTLEEAFAFENLVWCQELANRDLGVRVRSSDGPTIEDTAARLHKRIHGKNFKKTDFALALLAKDPDAWTIPAYILEGLNWLEAVVSPPLPPVAPIEGAAGDAGEAPA